MTKITHALKFETVLDENHPTAKRLLALSIEEQVYMLEGMLKDLLVPAVSPIIAELNAGSSWAVLKVAE
jgi:hypothetical protein